MVVKDTDALLSSSRDGGRESPEYGSTVFTTTVHNGGHGEGGSVQRNDTTIKVYKRRWYIMALFGLMSMSVCAVWNTFSPIANVAERVLDWDDGTLFVLSNYGPLAYLMATPFFSWIIDEKGLRPACLLSAFLLAAGTSLRCITSEPTLATPLIHIGQFVSCLAGPIAMGAPTVVSTEWFPPKERTTATAIASTLNTLGAALSFIIGPYLVPDTMITKVPGPSRNDTETSTQSSVALDEYPDVTDVTVYDTSTSSVNNNTTTEYDIATDRHHVMLYMYYSCGFTVFCFLLFFTYFPSRPPRPPSPTASVQRLAYKDGLKQLVRNRSFWLICLAYGLPLGIQGCWQGVLDVNLKSHDITQTTAAWLGFWGTISGCVASMLIARGADSFARNIKWFLVVLFVVGGCSFLVFAFSLVNIVPADAAIIYSTFIIGSICLGACTPLFFESACEVTYPVAEGVTTLVLTLVNNMSGLLFLAIQLIPHIGTMWENWSLVGGIFVCVPILLFMKQEYKRLDIDLEVEEEKRGDNSNENV